MKNIGRYEIVEQLGQGAMGVVYKASDPTIGRLVAIKVLSLGTVQEEGVPDARETFMREARAAGRLSHPGIVTIHDALEDPESGSGYIVMEFVPGRTLESMLASGASLTIEQSLGIIHQIAEALDYAHQQQVIHRDLKPANIILTVDGRAKIMDFGIAKIMAREGTWPGGPVMGTPSYMSPEQVTGTEVDARSDLFSVGIIAYFLLTGQKPFAGEADGVMFKIAYEDPVLPSRVNPKLGEDHDYLLLRCLAKDRDKRYARAQEILDDLDDIESGQAPRSRANFPVEQLHTGEPTMVGGKPIVAAMAGAGTASGKESTWLAVAGLIAIILIALVAVGVRARHRMTPSASSGAAQTISGSPSPAPQTPGTGPAPADVSPAASPPGEPTTETALSDQPKQELAPAPGDGAPNADQTTRPPHRVAKKPVNAIPPANPAQPLPMPTVAETQPTQPPLASPQVLTPQPALDPNLGGRAVQIVCHHQLKQATLTVSTGTQSLLQWPLKGIKKGGFLGIKGGYAGTLSRSLKIPAGAHELSVHVVSSDGSVDLSQAISAMPPVGASATLQVSVSANQLTLNWIHHGPASQ